MIGCDLFEQVFTCSWKTTRCTILLMFLEWNFDRLKRRPKEALMADQYEKWAKVPYISWNRYARDLDASYQHYCVSYCFVHEILLRILPISLGRKIFCKTLFSRTLWDIYRENPVRYLRLYLIRRLWLNSNSQWFTFTGNSDSLLHVTCALLSNKWVVKCPSLQMYIWFFYAFR